MRALFRPPWRRITFTILAILGLVIYRIFTTEGQFWGSLNWLFSNGLICGLGIFFWILFFAQFALPVRTLQDRFRAFERLTLYIQGAHGPAIFIRNGTREATRREMERRGPGVILADTASAAMLRTDQRITRVAGPGITFTEADETIAGEVDLRLQSQTIGPQERYFTYLFADEPLPNEAEGEFQNRMAERRATRALTRDGIEIVPRITVFFKINANHGDGNSEFGFNPEPVQLALTSRPIDANLPPDSNRLVEWRWIPARLAADIWKEYLGKFTLQELFHGNLNQNSALQNILQAMTQRLTNPEYIPLDVVGRSLGEAVESREYRLLNQHGIRVFRVEVTDLILPDTVERELIRRWRANWLNQARRERDAIETLRGYATDQGRSEAELETIRSAANYVVNGRPGLPQRCVDILARLLQGNVELIVRNPQLHQSMNEEVGQIREMIEWAEGRE